MLGRVDPKTGEVTGVVADLVREWGRRRNLPVAIIPAPSAAGVIERLNAGQVDIEVIAREAALEPLVDFSEPYLLMGNAYLVRSDSPLRRSASTPIVSAMPNITAVVARPYRLTDLPGSVVTVSPHHAGWGESQRCSALDSNRRAKTPHMRRDGSPRGDLRKV